MSRHLRCYDVTRENKFSLSHSVTRSSFAVALLLPLANYATCRVSVVASYQDESRLIETQYNRIDINDLQTLCSTHLTSNPSPPSRTRRLSRTTGKLRWVLRLCKLRAVPSLQHSSKSFQFCGTQNFVHPWVSESVSVQNFSIFRHPT